MALFNKNAKKANGEPYYETTADTEQDDLLSETELEIESDPEQKPATGNPNVKPRFARKLIISDEETEDDVLEAEPPVMLTKPSEPLSSKTVQLVQTEITTDAPPTVQPDTAPRVPANTYKNQREKVSLSVDINRELHARLRIHSFKTGQPLGVLVETMIRQCYPSD